MVQQTRQESNPDLRGWSSACFRYTTNLRERTARLERASPEWRSGALFPMSYVRVDTPGWSRTSVLCPRKAVLASAELRAFEGASGRI